MRDHLYERHYKNYFAYQEIEEGLMSACKHLRRANNETPSKEVNIPANTNQKGQIRVIS